MVRMRFNTLGFKIGGTSYRAMVACDWLVSFQASTYIPKEASVAGMMNGSLMLFFCVRSVSFCSLATAVSGIALSRHAAYTNKHADSTVQLPA